MQKLQVKRYKPRNPILRKLIKYYWFLKTDQIVNVNNVLFPSNNIDFILNLSSPIKYISNAEEVTFERFHFSGIRNRYRVIQQSGILNVMGISFYSTGAYPFLKIPLSDFSNMSISLNDVIPNFDSSYESLVKAGSITGRIDKLEQILMQVIDYNLLPGKELNSMIDRLYCCGTKMCVGEYCDDMYICKKTLERMFKKYVGITPKSFIKLTRFQKSLKQLIDKKYDNLTSLTYDNGYFDQMHFIKDFKTYMGVTPSKFIENKNTVIEMLKPTGVEFAF